MTVAERFWDHVDRSGECWLWKAAVRETGYGQWRFRGKDWQAHRVAWVLENAKEIPSGLLVLHSCDTKLCVRPSHLRVGTQTENMRDAIKRGRWARGERHGIAKVSENDVIDMKTLLAFGATQAELCRQYGRCDSWMNQLAAGKIWKHV